MNASSTAARDSHATGLRIEVLSSEPALAAFADEWDALSARGETALPFNSHAWTSACWQHFHRRVDAPVRASLYVIVVYENDGLAAIAPLWIDRFPLPGLTLEIVRWIGEGPSDYGELLLERCDHRLVDAVVAHLFAGAGPSRLVDLRECRGDSPTLPALRRALAAHATRWEELPDSLCYAIDVSAGWEAYLRGQFRHKKRTDLRREQRHLLADGGFEYAFLTRIEPMDATADSFGAVQAAHVAAGEARPGEFNDPLFRPFMEALLARAAEHGWLRTAVLTHHGEVVAYLIGFVYRGRCYLYNTAHDARCQRHGGGKLLMLYLFERVVGEGSTLIDFLRGAESYKESLTNRSQTNVRLLAGGPGTTGRLTHWLYARGLPWLARRQPRLDHALRLAGEQGVGALVARVVALVARPTR